MNVLLVLAIVVGSCVCGVQAQHVHYYRNFRQTTRNTTPYIKGKETQVFENKENEETLVHVHRSEIQKGKRHSIRENHGRSRDIQRNIEARILNMNKRHPNRGKLHTLPGLVWQKQESASRINTSTSIQSRDCTFVCPQAESLTPCTCDPCTHAINCSGVASFEQLFSIFHGTIFPNPRFESFLLVSPLKRNHRGTARSNTFLPNTFGDASFTSITVESVGFLTVVEAGAFRGSEATLKSLVLRWNDGLNYFPFREIGNMAVLQTLEVSGSSLTSLPALPHTPNLCNLFLQNNFINNIAPKTFADLSSLTYLDLAFNSLYDLTEGSLHFSSQDVMVFLDDNAIDHINKQAFSGQQPVLLDVSYNALTGLDQKVFQPVLDNIIDHGYDSYVDATSNPLQCPSISWLLEDLMYLYFVALPDLSCYPQN